MDRVERAGLGVAVVGHVVLFGLMSVGFLSTPNPVKLQPKPVEVSLVEEVALEPTSTAAPEPPAQSRAPEEGAPEDAAPPEPAEPEPTPPAPPPPAPAPPKPTPPKPAPPKPTPAPKPEPAPKPTPKPVPKPAPAPKPTPKPAPKPKPKPAPAAAPAAKPRPAARPAPAAAKPQPAKPDRASSSASRPTTSRPGSAPSRPATPSRTTGTQPSPQPRQRGSRLGDDFLKGLTPEPSKSRAPTPPAAAKLDARALAGIQDAIARQIQPCADRQVDPGPGANEIVTTLNLRLNPDGTLASTPTMVRQTGITDENSRYAQRVRDLGIAAFKGCAPLRLPAEYYRTPGGGWYNINYNWKLR